MSILNPVMFILNVSVVLELVLIIFVRVINVAGIKERGRLLLILVCTTIRNQVCFGLKREGQCQLLSSYSWVLHLSALCLFSNSS